MTNILVYNRDIDFKVNPVLSKAFDVNIKITGKIVLDKSCDRYIISINAENEYVRTMDFLSTAYGSKVVILINDEYLRRYIDRSIWNYDVENNSYEPNNRMGDFIILPTNSIVDAVKFLKE